MRLETFHQLSTVVGCAYGVFGVLFLVVLPTVRVRRAGAVGAVAAVQSLLGDVDSPQRGRDVAQAVPDDINCGHNDGTLAMQRKPILGAAR